MVSDNKFNNIVEYFYPQNQWMRIPFTGSKCKFAVPFWLCFAS